MTKILLAILILVLPFGLYGDFVGGSTTCPASGAKKVSTTTHSMYQITLLANSANTGIIYIGGADVSSTTGAALAAGWGYNASKPNPGINPATLYFACSVSGDGLTWIGSR